VAFYVDEHNTRLPHSAFRGQTPDEMWLFADLNATPEARPELDAMPRTRVKAKPPSAVRSAQP
jgi:hypothetical protein